MEYLEEILSIKSEQHRIGEEIERIRESLEDQHDGEKLMAISLICLLRNEVLSLQLKVIQLLAPAGSPTACWARIRQTGLKRRGSPVALREAIQSGMTFARPLPICLALLYWQKESQLPRFIRPFLDI